MITNDIKSGPFGTKMRKGRLAFIGHHNTLIFRKRRDKSVKYFFFHSLFSKSKIRLLMFPGKAVLALILLTK